jgi:hypothetical protein
MTTMVKQVTTHFEFHNIKPENLSIVVKNLQIKYPYASVTTFYNVGVRISFDHTTKINDNFEHVLYRYVKDLNE